MRFALALLVISLVVVDGWSGWERGDSVRMERDARADQRQLIRWLSLTGIHSMRSDIGELGFALPDVRITDLDGLTDVRIGHTAGGHLRKRFDFGYLFDERRPEVIVIRVRRLPKRDVTGQLKPIWPTRCHGRRATFSRTGGSNRTIGSSLFKRPLIRGFRCTPEPSTSEWGWHCRQERRSRVMS